MSEIDQYNHRCLGIVSCPSKYEPFKRWGREIPLYRFDSESTDALDTFQAKRGDILMGGGRGECSAVRIAMPEALLGFTHDDWDDLETLDELVQAYWSVTEAFIFCDGFHRLGWHPSSERFENWLCEHVIAFLVKEYGDVYRELVGSSPIEQDGSICRLPTDEERRILRPKSAT